MGSWQQRQAAAVPRMDARHLAGACYTCVGTYELQLQHGCHSSSAAREANRLKAQRCPGANSGPLTCLLAARRCSWFLCQDMCCISTSELLPVLLPDTPMQPTGHGCISECWLPQDAAPDQQGCSGRHQGVNGDDASRCGGRHGCPGQLPAAVCGG